MQRHTVSDSLLTVEVGLNALSRQQTVDGDLVDNVQQQECHTGEAEGFQQAPRVAWGKNSTEWDCET